MTRLVVLVLLGVISICVRAELFKWVDENGVTHYSDTIPPKYSKSANAQLNKKGQVVRQTDRALTEAEIKARDDERARRQEQELKDAEERRKNEVLLAAYAREDEIDLARDRALEPYDGRINVAQDRIKFIQTRIQEIQRDLEFYGGKDKDGKPKKPPVYLLKQRDGLKGELKVLDDSIKAEEAEKQKTVVRYAEFKQRYREAKANGVAGQTGEKIARPSVDKAPDALVKDCFGRWADVIQYQGQRRAYVVFAEIYRLRQPEELVLDTRARNSYGEFTTIKLVCPLRADGAVDDEGTAAKKALFTANRG
jgi:Domain of unknown function (DUF4124)